MGLGFRVAMRRAPLIIGLLLALGAGVAFGALVLGDDESDSNGGTSASTTTVGAAPPKLKASAKSKVQTDLAAHGFAASQPFTRQVTVQGATYAWNGAAGNYQPTGSFSRQALLAVDTDGNFGIFAGRAGDASAGQIWFATNSYVFRLIQGPAASVYNSRTPVAQIAEGNGGSTLQAVVTTNARAVQLNEFSVVGQIAPKQILSGTMQLNLSQSGASGTIDLYGGGYIEPGNSFPVDLYRATFSG